MHARLEEMNDQKGAWKRTRWVTYMQRSLYLVYWHTACKRYTVYIHSARAPPPLPPWEPECGNLEDAFAPAGDDVKMMGDDGDKQIDEDDDGDGGMMDCDDQRRDGGAEGSVTKKSKK